MAFYTGYSLDTSLCADTTSDKDFPSGSIGGRAKEGVAEDATELHCWWRLNRGAALRRRRCGILIYQMNQVQAVDRGCAKIFRQYRSSGRLILLFNLDSKIES